MVPQKIAKNLSCLGKCWSAIRCSVNNKIYMNNKDEEKRIK